MIPGSLTQQKHPRQATNKKDPLGKRNKKLLGSPHLDHSGAPFYTLPKTNIALKMVVSNRNLLFF